MSDAILLSTILPVVIPENDPRTGLPALPKEYFWRISRFGKPGEYEWPLRVELRRSTRFGRSVQVASKLSYGSKKSVLESAREVYAAASANQQDAIVHAEVIADLVGDYPPRKL